MGGVFPNETSIYIVAADVNASALTVNDKIVGEFTNWKKSGGEKDSESIPVIGGFVDKDKPQAQIELSFDFIVQNTATSTLDRYDVFQYGSGLTSATSGSDRAVYISHISGGFSKLTGFNNCNVITTESNMDADDMLRGTMTLKLSPQTALGVANIRTSTISGSTLPGLKWV